VDLDELLAREAVRDLVARYNANADTGRFEQVVELFTEDAVIELPDERIEGRAAIEAMFRGVQSTVLAATPAGRPPYLRHFTATQQIDVEGAERATSRCYFLVLMPAGLDHWGRYVDELARVDGVWKIARRRVSVDGRRPDSPFAE
jgi:hypothetical protein